MVDLIFSIEGSKYKLTSDERQYILQRLYISDHPKAKNPGEEKLTDAKFFRSIQNVFDYISRTHALSCKRVISSLEDLKSSQTATDHASEALSRSIIEESYTQEMSPINYNC